MVGLAPLWEFPDSEVKIGFLAGYTHEEQAYSGTVWKIRNVLLALAAG